MNGENCICICLHEYYSFGKSNLEKCDEFGVCVETLSNPVFNEIIKIKGELPIKIEIKKTGEFVHLFR